MITAAIVRMEGYDDLRNAKRFAEQLGISRAEYIGRLAVIKKYFRLYDTWSDESFVAFVASGQYMNPEAMERPDPPQVPGLKQSAATLAKEAKRILLSKKVEAAVFKARLAICQKCDRFIAGRCAMCGCYMRLKCHFSLMRCPAGLWEAEE